MKYRNSIIALGFLVVVIQYLGFPQSVREILLVLSGAAIIGLAYLSGNR